MRVAVKLCMLKPDGKVEHNNEAHWKRYQCHFESPHNELFAVENRKFYHKRAKILSLNFKRWKTKDKSQYINHFSHENWKDLPELEKKTASKSRLSKHVLFTTTNFRLYFLHGAERVQLVYRL